MEQEYLKNLDELGKNTFGATRELLELNGRILEKVLQRQLSVANLFVEGSERQAALVKEANDPQAYFQKQSELFEEYAGKFAEYAQDGVKLAQDTGEDLRGWFEKGLATAEKAGAPVVKAAEKKAA